MAVLVVKAICKNNTCYLCTEKHRENGREHRENTGKTQGIYLNLNVATLILKSND